ncbi:hypothetical protein Efla_000662 [Eimeria flavescens]
MPGCGVRERQRREGRRLSSNCVQKEAANGLLLCGFKTRRLADSFIEGSLEAAFQCATSCRMEPFTSVPPSLVIANKADRPRKKRCTDTPANTDEQTRRQTVFKNLVAIYGFGRFAAENMMQLLGFFDVDVFDSETARFMRERHGLANKDIRRVWEAARRQFERYRPFQFLAYWFELWKMYEASVGTESPGWTPANSFFVSGENPKKQLEGKSKKGKRQREERRSICPQD